MPENAELLKHKNWDSRVKTALNDLILTYGGQKNAYAVFDFDNTTGLFDIEHQLLIYQLMTMAFAMRPTEIRETLLTGIKNPAPYEALLDDIETAYALLWRLSDGLDGTMRDFERYKKMPIWQEFAVKMRYMFSLVSDLEDDYVGNLFPLVWFRGMTGQQVYDLSFASHTYFAKQTTKVVQWVSPKEIDSHFGQCQCRWVRGVGSTPNIAELWQTLRRNGIDVHVCSASATIPVQAALDAFGLRRFCSGMTGVNLKTDENGRILPQVDGQKGWLFNTKSGWQEGEHPLQVMPIREGKTKAILQGLCPVYHQGPLAGFMDSTGDVPFCTAFDSLKLVVCFNRASGSPREGGAIIAALSEFQRKKLEYDLKKANAAGDTLYVLQGRDETGLRSLRPSPKTRRVVADGVLKEILYKGQENEEMERYMCERCESTSQALEFFLPETNLPNELGFAFGIAGEKTSGYHAIYSQEGAF